MCPGAFNSKTITVWSADGTPEVAMEIEWLHLSRSGALGHDTIKIAVVSKLPSWHCFVTHSSGLTGIAWHFAPTSYVADRPRHDKVEAVRNDNNNSHGHITCLHDHHLSSACTRAHSGTVL